MVYVVIKSHRQVQIVPSLNGSAQLQSPSPRIASAKAGFCGSLMNPAVSNNEDGTLHRSYVKSCGMTDRWAASVSLGVGQHELYFHQGCLLELLLMSQLVMSFEGIVKNFLTNHGL